MTIQDYIKEIDALSTYYFNNIKEDDSKFVEALTTIHNLHSNLCK